MNRQSWPLLLAAAALLIASGVRIWATAPGDQLASGLFILGAAVLGAWVFSEAQSK